ncbi:hypothetical protein D805_0285 [Bifidobacterium thermophilum RBL67]|uniref:Uncharacterized protein n=1 Tax=Bifidobacterium thermophilum RBL67 TaxID=1254439 RepID=M4RPU2_9BIFI|nr:hypothetical protein D805_0285 [Bifidobacterium thermophilum RBL67]
MRPIESDRNQTIGRPQNWATIAGCIVPSAVPPQRSRPLAATSINDATIVAL